MCKTSQMNGPMNKSIFYKRYYTLNKTTKELFVRNKPGQDLKEKADLSEKLAFVKTDLSRTLSNDYRQLFQGIIGKPIVLPNEFQFPFALVFKDGSI